MAIACALRLAVQLFRGSESTNQNETLHQQQVKTIHSKIVLFANPRNNVKFFIDNWYLFVLALASGSMLMLPALRGASLGGLPAPSVVQLINREKAVLIDVCAPEEFAAAHAGGAKNVPLAELEARLTSVVKNKAVPVVMVCATGGRAAKAAVIARKLGYEKAQVLAGGLRSWREAGLPVEKS